MKFSVCTDAVFAGLPFFEAAQLSREAGADGLEFWGWWTKDLTEVSRGLQKSGLPLCAMCTPFVSLTDPCCRSEYLAGLCDTLRVCRELSCRTVISQVGQELNTSRERQTESVIDGLKTAAALLVGTGITLVIEPLNTRVDHPGYFLTRSQDAYRIVREVNSPQVKVLFDIYHQQITEGDILTRMLEGLSDIGHIHFAGSAGRHEPENGEVAYEFLFRRLGQAGYSRFAGLEYFPQSDAAGSVRKVCRELRG